MRLCACVHVCGCTVDVYVNKERRPKKEYRSLSNLKVVGMCGGKVIGVLVGWWSPRQLTVEPVSFGL